MKILCFGSLNIDKVYTVSHFVRAGETISSHGYARFPGGKGLNQSIAAAKAGAQVVHAGLVGTDGEMLLETLRSAGVNTDFIQTLPDTPSGHAVIQVDASGQNCIIIHGGANTCMTEPYIDSVLASFSAGHLILLQNEINQLPYILKKARERGLFIVFNPSPITEEMAQFPLELVDLFILNEIEGAHLSGKTEPDDILAEMRKKFPQSSVLLTLGEMGSCYCDETHIFTQSIVKVKAVDTTAAGDTFTGYFLAGRSEGKPVEECLRLAAAASALTVSRKGASISIPYRQETEEFIK